MTPNQWAEGGFDVDMSDLIGKTFTSVAINDDKTEMRFVFNEGSFVFFHNQDCCESVDINDVVGDLNDLVGTPLLKAEESTSNTTPEGFTHEYEPESQTWTFYKFATIKGYVDVRWFGESNGYYGEGVDLKFEPPTFRESKTPSACHE